jgi:hypothetical protein
MTTITVRKHIFDTSDPCSVAEALKLIRLQIAAGGQAEVVRFGDDEVRYTRANLKALDREIERYETACSLMNGGRRRRFAKRIRFIPG